MHCHNTPWSHHLGSLDAKFVKENIALPSCQAALQETQFSVKPLLAYENQCHHKHEQAKEAHSLPSAPG